MGKKIWLGAFLALIILSTSFYILMPSKLRIDFQETRTIFKVYEDGKFVISGIEYVRIFDGTRLMRAKNRTINYTLLKDETMVQRKSSFKDGIMIRERYMFSNNVTNVDNVPIAHSICFTNANGKIFEYMIDRITYDGETKDIISPFSFGKNMKLTFQDGYYRAKVYNYKYASDKVKIRYRVTDDYQCFDVRLFDPKKEKKMEYGATWDRSCDEGTCNMLLYSGVRNANENGTRIENAKSLKDCQFCDSIILSIKEDKKYPIKVIDYNYTSITLDVQAVTLELNKDIPLEAYSIEKAFDEKTQEFVENKTIHFEDTANLNSISDKQNFIIPFGFNKIVEWGFNSTTIKLQDNESENLEDAVIFEADPNTNYGYLTFFNLDARASDGREEFLIKFNISSIPLGSTIESAMFYAYMFGEGIDDTEEYHCDAHHVENQSWDELTVTWNMAIAMTYNSTYESRWTATGADPTPDAPNWLNWTVTNMVTKDFSAGISNFSVWIRTVYSSGDPGALDDLDIYSKEHSDTTLRPYLNVTYTEAEPPPPVINCTPAEVNTGWYANMSFCCNFTIGDYSDGIDLGTGDYIPVGPVECGVWNFSTNLSLSNIYFTNGTTWFTTTNGRFDASGK